MNCEDYKVCGSCKHFTPFTDPMCLELEETRYKKPLNVKEIIPGWDGPDTIDVVDFEENSPSDRCHYTPSRWVFTREES